MLKNMCNEQFSVDVFGGKPKKQAKIKFQDKIFNS